MKIDHIALWVSDLEGARQFFVQFFGGVAGEPYHNPRTGLSTYFITFPDGGRVEIMARPDVEGCGAGAPRCGYTHLAFSVGSREEVDALTRRLADAGYATLSGPRVTGDGYYESSVSGFEGNILEITV